MSFHEFMLVTKEGRVEITSRRNKSKKYKVGGKKYDKSAKPT